MIHIPAVHRRTGYTVVSLPRASVRPHEPSPTPLERFWQATLREWHTLRQTDAAQAEQQAAAMRSALDQLCQILPAPGLDAVR